MKRNGNEIVSCFNFNFSHTGINYDAKFILIKQYSIYTVLDELIFIHLTVWYNFIIWLLNEIVGCLNLHFIRNHMWNEPYMKFLCKHLDNFVLFCIGKPQLNGHQQQLKSNIASVSLLINHRCIYDCMCITYNRKFMCKLVAFRTVYNRWAFTPIAYLIFKYKSTLVQCTLCVLH